MSTKQELISTANESAAHLAERCEAAEASLTALRGRIEALAEHYEGRAEEKLDHILDAIEPEVIAEELRDLLAERPRRE